MAPAACNPRQFFRPSPPGLAAYLRGLPGLNYTALNEHLNSLYSCCPGACLHAPELQQLAANDWFATIAAQITGMAKQVYESRGMPAAGIDKAVVKEVADRLWSGVETGFGKMLPDIGSVDYEAPHAALMEQLNENVWHFSAAKNHQQLKDLSRALVDENGKLRTWAQFKPVAMEINDKQVNQWLKAEYENAVTSAEMAAKWQDIVADKDIMPKLEFDAVMDTQTTEICAPLNGIIRPVDDAFWKTYYPPNHWNCRSTVRQLSSSVRVTQKSKLVLPDITPLFMGNVGITGQAFPKGHPYFTDCPQSVLDEADRLRLLNRKRR